MKETSNMRETACLSAKTSDFSLKELLEMDLVVFNISASGKEVLIYFFMM